MVIHGQLSQGRAASGIGLPFVLHQRLEPHTPVCPNAAVIDLALIQELSGSTSVNAVPPGYLPLYASKMIAGRHFTRADLGAISLGYGVTWNPCTTGVAAA